MIKKIIKTIETDQYSEQMVREALKDDQGLNPEAKDIKVSVKDGTVTLEGKVTTEQQLNLATNTASAIAVDDKINNQMEVSTYPPR